MESSELALWRYSVIAPLLHRGAGVSVTQMAGELAAQVKQGPDGTIRVAGKVFEVRAHLAGSHVRVRFNPNGATKVFYRPLKDSEALFEEAFPIE